MTVLCYDSHVFHVFVLYLNLSSFVIYFIVFTYLWLTPSKYDRSVIEKQVKKILEPAAIAISPRKHYIY